MDDVLIHYGVLGMKWGVRRYQNKDGSLTPKGKKRYSKELYSEMKKNDGKLYRTDYRNAVKNKLSNDKRVKDYVSSNSKEYKKILREWGNIQDKIDKEYETDDIYKRAYKKAIKNGGDPKQKHFDDYAFELMGEDKKISELESQSEKAWNNLNEYSKKAKILVDDIIGKYGNMPANALYDHNVKAESWIYSALEDLMNEYKD